MRFLANVATLRTRWDWSTAVHPRQAVKWLAESGCVRCGAAPLLACAVAWALLALAIGLSGQPARAVWLPVKPEHYYLLQAAFTVPLLLGTWGLLGLVAHTLARALSGTGTLRSTVAATGYAYAVPVLFLFVLPDWVVFLGFGFQALAPAMRFYAPLAAVATWLLTAISIHDAHGLGRGRAIFTAWVALLVQAAAGATLLR